MEERSGKMKKVAGFFKKYGSRLRLSAICIVVGALLGAGLTVFLQSYNPPDEEKGLAASVVFERIVSKDELVSAAQSYSIVEKVEDTNQFFGLFDIPFSTNSFWYRYVGTIKAGVDLKTAEFAESDGVVTITLSQPYVIANTPDMDQSGVLEENNNILNPIHVEDVDAFQRTCVEKSQTEVMEGGLMDEARVNAEENLTDMFTAALGDECTVQVVWRES